MRIQEIKLPFKTSIQLFVKREDEIHPLISGNKFYKLKYNILKAKELNSKILVTFGGAFSNHILAVAAVGNENDFKTFGIIRGEELENNWQENPTLKRAVDLGMNLVFVDREEYRLKEMGKTCKEFLQQNPLVFVIPEGGTNEFAVEGTKEILNTETIDFQYICASVGTGGTLAGLSLAADEKQEVIGFSALKNGGFLVNEILKFTPKQNFDVILDYHFGGYGKITAELISFMNEFYSQNSIPLDAIYTGKMMFGVFDLIQNSYFKENSKILVIHTGGLQGNEGMKTIIKSKIKIDLIY